MIEIKTTREIALNAYQQALQMGELRHSIMNGKGNFIGFIGEGAAKSYLQLPIDVIENTYDFDLTFKENKIDVKSKKTSVRPSSNHECSVAAYNTRQKCNYYLFTRVYQPADKRIPTMIYLMGYYPKELYYQNARFLRKGQKDGSNGFIVREDCYNMYYRDLFPMEDIWKI